MQAIEIQSVKTGSVFFLLGVVIVLAQPANEIQDIRVAPHPGWESFKTAKRLFAVLKNADLWRLLDEARLRHKISWHWVKGHAGEAENERADELARSGMAPFKKPR